MSQAWSGIKKKFDRLKFNDYREKVLIFRNCSKLEGYDQYVAEDLSQKVHAIRKKNFDITASNRNRKKCVKLVFDKISVNGKLYIWNDKKQKGAAILKRALQKHRPVEALER